MELSPGGREGRQRVLTRADSRVCVCLCLAHASSLPCWYLHPETSSLTFPSLPSFPCFFLVGHVNSYSSACFLLVQTAKWRDHPPTHRCPRPLERMVSVGWTPNPASHPGVRLKWAEQVQAALGPARSCCYLPFGSKLEKTWRPGQPLGTLQSTRQAPKGRIIPPRNVSSAETENLALTVSVAAARGSVSAGRCRRGYRCPGEACGARTRARRWAGVGSCTQWPATGHVDRRVVADWPSVLDRRACLPPWFPFGFEKNSAFVL